MSLVINTNIAARVAQQNLAQTSSQLKVSVQRLSSGFRVNSAADDAAGLGRTDQLRSHSRMIQVSIRNINDGVSALEVADKAAGQITDIVSRMGELAASAAQGTLNAAGRSYYSDEYNKLIQEIDRIAQTTEFGGYKVLNGTTEALTMYVGFKNSANDQLPVSLYPLFAGGWPGSPDTSQEMVSAETVPDPADAVSAGGWFQFTVGGGPVNSVFLGVGATLNNLVSDVNSLGAGVTASVEGVPGDYSVKLVSDTPGTGNDIVITQNDTVFQNFGQTAAQDAVAAGGLGLDANALTSAAGALGALDAISAALKVINDARAVYGASTNRLTAALSNLQVTYLNFQAAESRIRDADFSFETAQYTRNQVMVQAGTSVLAQANSLPKNVLTLLS